MRNPQVDIVDVTTEEVLVIGQDQDLSASFANKLTDRTEIGDTLNNEEQHHFLGLLKKHDGVFHQDEDDLGYCDIIKPHIILTDTISVKIPHRLIPSHQWNEVHEYMRKAIVQGIIRGSSNPYAPAVVLVRKSDGRLRLCVD